MSINVHLLAKRTCSAISRPSLVYPQCAAAAYPVGAFCSFCGSQYGTAPALSHYTDGPGRDAHKIKLSEGGLPAHKQVVLVVDDEPVIRLTLAVHLEENGFKVLEAGCAADAIAILEEPGSIVKLVFSDVRMPGEMDGISLSRWIFESRPNIAVILATGDLGKTTAMEDLCGAEAMGKPFNIEAATNKIRNAIRKKSPPSD